MYQYCFVFYFIFLFLTVYFGTTFVLESKELYNATFGHIKIVAVR